MSLSRDSLWRHHRLSAKSALPLFDSVFAVAVTLLAFSIPDRLDGVDLGQLLAPILAFEFIGIAILLYWFKFRRLIIVSRLLTLPQLCLIFFGLMAVVLLPRMSDLVLNYGGGSGSLHNWTLSQAVNVNFLVALFLVDGFTLLFALSLYRHPFVLKTSRNEIVISVRAQWAGFLGLCVLACMEIFLPWFNNEFVIIVPIVLILEEALVARQFSRGLGARSCHLPCTSSESGLI